MQLASFCSLVLPHCSRRKLIRNSVIVVPETYRETLAYVVDGDVYFLRQDDESDSDVLIDHFKKESLWNAGLLFGVKPPQSWYLRLSTYQGAELAEIQERKLSWLLNNTLKDFRSELLSEAAGQLAHQLTEARGRIYDWTKSEVYCRVEKALKKLSELRGVETDEGIEIQVSRMELAILCGCTREVAGRVLIRMSTEGKVRTGKRLVVLVD